MKKIIDGKTYNTETATLIAEYQYSHRGDFHGFLEEVYRTKKGAYFMYFWGGGMSKYAESVGNNSYSEGEGIKLITESEAKEFAEEHLDADDYIEFFGEVEEG